VKSFSEGRNWIISPPVCLKEVVRFCYTGSQEFVFYNDLPSLEHIREIIHILDAVNEYELPELHKLALKKFRKYGRRWSCTLAILEVLMNKGKV
jgi:hypothetical protein